MLKNFVCTPKKGTRKHFLGKSYWEKFFLTQDHGHMQSLGSCGALLFLFSPPPPPYVKKVTFWPWQTPIFIYIFGIFSSIIINLAQTVWCSDVILKSLTNPKSQLVDLGYISVIQGKHIRPILLYIFGFIKLQLLGVF